MRFRGFFKAHRYKILVGTPIIFLLIMNSAEVLEPANRYTVTGKESPFLTTGSVAHFTLAAHTDMSVNALGGTITFPTDLIAVDTVSKDPSMVSLWSEEPAYSNTEGTIKFSGGILDRKEALKNAPVLTLSMHGLKPGKVVLRMQNGMLLANNGKGTNIENGNEHLITLWIREPKTPSPDLTGDGTLSIADVNTLYVKTFRAYDSRYDLNQDGKVNWGDVKFLTLVMNS